MVAHEAVHAHSKQVGQAGYSGERGMWRLFFLRYVYAGKGDHDDKSHPPVKRNFIIIVILNKYLAYIQSLICIILVSNEVQAIIQYIYKKCAVI